MASFYLNAQTIALYDLQKPELSLENVKTVWFEKFENKSPEQWNINTDFFLRDKMYEYLNKPNMGYGYSVDASWIRTDWYIPAKSKAEADLIVSGDFKIDITEEIKVIEKSYKENQPSQKYKDKSYKVPYVVRQYDFKYNFLMTTNVVIKLKSGKKIFEKTYTTERSAGPGSVFGKKPTWNNSQERTKAISSVAYTVTSLFMPSIKIKKVALVEIDKNKKTRKMLREINDDIRHQQYEVAAAKYLKFNNPKGYYNAAVLLMRMGKFKQAKEYLNKSNHKLKNEHLIYMQSLIDLQKSVGIIEPQME